MPSNIRDNGLQDPESNDDDIGITDELNDSRQGSQNSSDKAEYSQSSAYHASPTGEGMTMPSPDEGPISRRTGTKRPSLFGLPRQHTSRPEGATIGDSRGYAPSPPFKEAGPTSSVWRACLDESWNHDTEMFGSQRGELNILLVFGGLFSAIATTFISQSSANLQPDYQQMSALLLFDLINVQRALANGTSLDHITSSGADPTAPFTPKYLDSVINGLWFASLSLSLLIAFVAILADQWIGHYLKPVDGDPQVRARTRHFGYKGLINSYVTTLIGFLPFMLRQSLDLFFIGLVLYLIPQQKGIALAIGIIFLIPSVVITLITIFPLMFPNSPYKTLFITSCFSLFTSMLRKFPKDIRHFSSLLFDIHPELETFEDFEMFAAERSRIETEVDALHWLYENSSTLAIHRLVIHALAGLPPDYIAYAKKSFSAHWTEIRDEKEGMLMDCMTLAQDDCTLWIPKDIPNIDRRIEPLLRLEVLFPFLCRNSTSGHFGNHHLDFSRKLSNNLSITLSSIDEVHIQKPMEQKQVVIDALAENGVHHPLVWKKILDCYVDQEKLFHDPGDVFTIEMCLNLVTSIYLPEDSPPELCSCTLAYASVKYYKPEILKGLLSFFSTPDSHNDPLVDPERSLLLAIVRTLAPDSAPSTFNSHQRYPFHHDHTISKYRLLRVALHAINKDIHYRPVNLPSKQWRTDVFSAILSYMMSDLFTGHSLSSSEDSEFKDLFWTCRAHALVCMASLMHGSTEYSAVEPNTGWATKSLFLNILRVIHDEPVGDAPHLSAIRIFPDLPQRFDSISGIVGFLLCQAFSWGIPEAYEAFREKDGLRYIAEKSSLHPELIEGLHGYITGLLRCRAGKFTDIQSDDFPDRHIQDLHQAHVIRCVCASIVGSRTPPRPILFYLASIAPLHPEWSKILDTLNSPDDEKSIEKYVFGSDTSPDDRENFRKDMKDTVEILDECLKAAKDRRNGINRSSMSFNRQTTLLGTQDRHQWLNWMRQPRNGNADVELQDYNKQRV